jgi:hypothetical protein
MNVLSKKAIYLILLLSLSNLQAANFWETIKNNLPTPTVKNAFLGACVVYTFCSLTRKCCSFLRSFGQRQEIQSYETEYIPEGPSSTAFTTSTTLSELISTPTAPNQLPLQKILSIRLPAAGYQRTIDTSNLGIYHPERASIDCTYTITRNTDTLKTIALNSGNRTAYTITQTGQLMYISDGRENSNSISYLPEQHPLRQWATEILSSNGHA